MNREFEDDSISITNCTFRFADLYSPELNISDQSVHLDHIVCNNSYGGVRIDNISGVDNLNINHITSVHNRLGFYNISNQRSETPVLKNSIIAFNRTGIKGRMGEGPFRLKNCLIFDNGIDYDYINEDCLYEDPQFLGAPHFPFHLSLDSPCIDAGDPDDQQDSDRTVTDIGAIPHKFNDIEPEIDRISPQSRECWVPVDRVKSFVVEVFDEDEGDAHDFLWTVRDSSFYASDSLTYAFDEPGVQTVEVIAIDGHYWSNRLRWDVDVLLGVEDENEPVAPLEFGITSTFPNPFNSATTIEYSLIHNSHVSLSIYNLAGQRVETLVNGKKQAGIRSTTFYASEMPSGLYFLQLESVDDVSTQKIMLIK